MGLSKARLATLDEDLSEYRKINTKIALRKLEIETQANDDENIGGGRSSFVSRKPESLAVRFSEDKHIQYLEQFKKDCELCYSKLEDTGKTIFELRWINNEKLMWEEIAGQLNYSRAQIYRKRYNILESFNDIRTKKA